jgi:hypothetical protein
VTCQSELKSLKLQVSRAEEALNDDGLIAKLEKEVNWFSEESGRLKMHAASMRKDMHHIVTRIEALKEQRYFLAEQLKAVLKRSKVLEMELGYLKTQRGTATMMGDLHATTGLPGLDDGGGFDLHVDGFDFSNTAPVTNDRNTGGFAATGMTEKSLKAKDSKQLRISASAPVLPSMQRGAVGAARAPLAPLTATGAAGGGTKFLLSSRRSPKATTAPRSRSPTRMGDTLLDAKPKPSRSKKHTQSGYPVDGVKVSRLLEKMIASR